MKALKIILYVVTVVAFLYSGSAYAQEALNVTGNLAGKLSADNTAASSILNEENDASMGGLKALKGINRFGFSLLGARKGMATNIAALQQRLSLGVPYTSYSVRPIDYYGLVSPTTRLVEYEYEQGSAYPSRIVEILPSGDRVTVCEIGTLISCTQNPLTDGVVISEITFLTYYMDDGSTVLVRFGGRPDLDKLLASASIAEGVYYELTGGTKITKVYNEYDHNGNRTFGIMMTTYFDEFGSVVKRDVIKERAYYDAAGKLIMKMTYFETDGEITKIITESNVYMDGRLFRKIVTTLNYNSDGTMGHRIIEEATFGFNGLDTRHTIKEYNGSRLVRSEMEETRFRHMGEDDPASNLAYLWVVAYHIREVALFDENGHKTFYSKDEEETTYNEANNIIRHRASSEYNDGSYSRTYEDITDYTYDADGDILTEHQVLNDIQNGNLTTIDRNRTVTYQFINGVKKVIMDNNVAITERDLNGDGLLERSRVLVKRSYHTYDPATGSLLQEQSIEIERTWGDGYLATIYQKNKIKDYDLRGNVIHEIVGTRNHYYYADGTINSSYDTKEINYAYGFVNGENKLLSKHLTRTISGGSGYQDTGCILLKIIRQFNADVTYNYDPETGKLAYVHTYGKETRDDGNVREVSIDEVYDDNGNVVMYAVLSYLNGVASQFDLVQRSYDENNILREEVKHFENFLTGFFYTERSVFNERGNLASLIKENSNGLSYSEEREYYEDGTTLKKVDIVSVNPPIYYWVPIFHDDRWWEEYLKEYKDENFRIPYDFEFFEEGLINYNGLYELHEEYLPDGKIIHRETLHDSAFPNGSAGFYPIYGGQAYSHVIQDWTYSDPDSSGERKLLHYKSVSEYRSNGWGWGWQANYTETVEQFYDPVSGKMLKETRVFDGEKLGLYFEYIGKDRLLLMGFDKEWIPEDVKNFLGEITTRFMNESTGHSEMTLEYVYNDDGGLNSIKVHWKQGRSEDDTTFVFDATIFVDLNGKIKTIEVSEGGEITEGFHIWLDQSIEVIIPERDPKFLEGQLQPVPQEELPLIQSEMADKMATLAAKTQAATCPQGVAMVGELAGKETEYNTQK